MHDAVGLSSQNVIASAAATAMNVILQDMKLIKHRVQHTIFGSLILNQSIIKLTILKERDALSKLKHNSRNGRNLINKKYHPPKSIY